MFASDLSIFLVGAIFLDSHAFARKKGVSTFQGNDAAFFWPFSVLKIYISVLINLYSVRSE